VRAAITALTLVAAVACGDNHRGSITIYSADDLAPPLVELAQLTPGVQFQPGTPTSDDDGGYAISVVRDATMPAESYQLVARGTSRVDVITPDVLGAQYGTAAALEALGMRFRHPFDPFIPETPVLTTPDDAVHRPQIRVRGLQLHTLHPIEGYFAFWEPSAAATNDAHRIIDWVIKNRGNFLQWVALDDILDPARHASWNAFTRELIDYAHLRGIRVGLNLQLFGQSNLQLAFDLVDDDVVPIADQIAARLPLITEGLPFDVYDLSFGEFFNADSQKFIDSVNEVHRQLGVLAPQAEMHAVVHVGADQTVTYLGEELLYYFLIKFADPAIIPDVHTVMFYDLFEPTGGAYKHESFDEHLAFLLDRMCNGKKAAYFPETAYWVAFDNSVPQFFPLYVHNRWLDLERLDHQPGCSALDEHLLFSSGWEWGYWLHDVTALHASYELPASPTDLISAELAPDLGAATAPVTHLIDVQRTHLMGNRLVQYLAGRDTAIDAGRQLGIVSQPDRVTFEDLAAGADPVAFHAQVIQPLARYAAELDAIARELDAADLPAGRWSAELRDGLAIDRLRARFVLETYGAALSQVAGDAAAATVHADRAAELLAAAQDVVAGRHLDLHDTHGRRLVDKTPNQTFYQFGYLFMADTLCYWGRELTQVRAMLGSTTTAPASCLF
jgi:hypothetical protein